MDPHCWGAVYYRDGDRLVGQGMGCCCLHHRSSQSSEHEEYPRATDLHAKVVRVPQSEDAVVLVDVAHLEERAVAVRPEVDHLEE